MDPTARRRVTVAPRFVWPPLGSKTMGGDVGNDVAPECLAHAATAPGFAADEKATTRTIPVVLRKSAP